MDSPTTLCGPELAFPCSSPNAFPDSPLYRERRPIRTPGSMRRSTSGSLSSSLAQSKVLRWSLAERVNELEGKLEDYHHISRLNADLRDQLRITQEENRSMIQRYNDLNTRVKSFVSKEELARKVQEHELHELKIESQSMKFDKDRLANECDRLKSEADIFKIEIDRLRVTCSESVDRTMHDRMLSDLRNEISSLRQSLEQSVDLNVHERLRSQLSESHCKVNSQELEINKLNRELEDLSCKCSDVVCDRDALQKTVEDLIQQIKDSKSLIEDGQKYRFTAEALKEAVKRNTELSVLVDQLKSQESSHKHEMKRLEDLRGVMSETVNTYRHDLTNLRELVRDQSSNFSRTMQDSLRRLHAANQKETASFISTVMDLLIKLEYIEGKVDQSMKLSDLAHVLKTCLKRKSDAYSSQASHLRSLVNELRSKEESVNRLRSSIEENTRTRRCEDEAMSKLRSSIESAELQLLRTRELRINHSSS